MQIAEKVFIFPFATAKHYIWNLDAITALVKKELTENLEFYNKPATKPSEPATTPSTTQPTTKPSTTQNTEAVKPKKTSIKKLSKGKKKFTVTWAKVSGVKGYQIQYSSDKKLKKNNKSVTVTKQNR